MKFISRKVRELFTVQEVLRSKADTNCSTSPQIIRQFFVSHHQDSIQIVQIRRGGCNIF